MRSWRWCARRIRGDGGRWDEARTNPAAVRMLAEGEAWRGHFETAAPMFLAIEANFPADQRDRAAHGGGVSVAGHDRSEADRYGDSRLRKN